MQEKSRILVVDDNEQFCQNVSDILEMKGYKVMTASDGFKALEMIKRNGLDLVLMDIKMPVMDGVETFKKVKEMAPDIPVIMVTAFAVEDLITEALLPRPTCNPSLVCPQRNSTSTADIYSTGALPSRLLTPAVIFFFNRHQLGSL